MVTNKKVSANVVELDEVDSFITEFLDYSDEADPVSVYLFGPGVKPRRRSSGRHHEEGHLGAAPTCSRSISLPKTLAANPLPTTSLTSHSHHLEQGDGDGVCELWHYNNSGTSEERPVQLGPIAVYLQIQVIENGPFEVLLGRPFFDVVGCSEISRSGGRHQIIFEQPTPISSPVISTRSQPAYLTTLRTRRNTYLKSSTNLTVMPFRSLHCLPMVVIRLLATTVFPMTTGLPTTTGLPVVAVNLSGDGEVAAIGQAVLSHCRTFGRVLVTYTSGSNDFGLHPFLWSYILVSQQVARSIRYRFITSAGIAIK